MTILAMASNREDFLDELMRRHISYINYKDKNNGTLMHIAATGGYVAAMEWLKKYGANIDIDAKNNDGDMPIHLAAGAGHINAVQWLLKNGKAGVNAKGQSGRTPMHQAAIQNRVEIIKYLKGQGADLYAEDDGNFSPMAAAARAREDCSESIRCLKNLGVCVNRPCSDTWTPIFGAAMTTQIANIKCLKDLGADIEAKDSEGKTPIFWAVEAGQIEALKFLVEKAKADICATDNYGLAPIFYAALHGQDEIIRCLCHDFNVCVDTVADNGITPIFAAASTGQSGTIDTLMNLGAKANRTAKDGRYPADYAKEGGYPEIAKHLHERAAIE